jgi:hypothetical protein
MTTTCGGVAGTDRHRIRVAAAAAFTNDRAAAPRARGRGSCATTKVLGWIVFDGGKPVTVDTAGSGDKKVDACVIRCLHPIVLPSCGDRHKLPRARSCAISAPSPSSRARREAYVD